MTGVVGVGHLVRLALRRDRVLMTVSVVALTAMTAVSAQATRALYDDPAEATEAARAVLANPSIIAMYGPVADLASVDALSVFKMLLTGAVFLALLGHAIVRRHTRTDEELGRLELLGAGVMGRRAPLAASVLVAVGVVVLASVATTAGLVAVGQDATGSVALGVAWMGVGITFVGVSAIAAQLAQTARGAGGITLSVLGIAYLLRAVGDTTEGPVGSALVWLSPLGWPEKMSIYGENRFVVGLVPIAATAGLLVLADRLLARRDLGSGLMAARPGPARGAAALGGPAGLSWRLQRGSLLGWTIAYALLGLVLGGISDNVVTMMDSPDIVEMLRRMGGDAGTLVDLFVRTELTITAIAAAGYGISTALRLSAEESSGRAEPVLAGAVTRPRWLTSHLGVALLGSAWLMVVIAVTISIAAKGGWSGGGTSLTSMLAAAAVTIPAVWVCIGLAAFVFGTVPRWVMVLWAALVAFLVLGEFGRTLELPQTLINVSPFPHIPPLPGGVLTLTPLVALTATATTLGLVGYAAFRRRDIG